MYYFMNFAGLTLTDDKMRQIRYPRTEVMFHVTCKTAQTGALLGAMVCGPLSCLQTRNCDVDSLKQKAFKCGKQGLIAGIIVGPLLAHMRLRSLNSIGIYDRAYRLRYNFNQVRTDRFTVLGGLVGAGAALYLGEALQQGALFGLCGGCLLAGIFNFVKGD